MKKHNKQQILLMNFLGKFYKILRLIEQKWNFLCCFKQNRSDIREGLFLEFIKKITGTFLVKKRIFFQEVMWLIEPRALLKVSLEL